MRISKIFQISKCIWARRINQAISNCMKKCKQFAPWPGTLFLIKHSFVRTHISIVWCISCDHKQCSTWPQEWMRNWFSNIFITSSRLLVDNKLQKTCLGGCERVNVSTGVYLRDRSCLSVHTDKSFRNIIEIKQKSDCIYHSPIILNQTDVRLVQN